MADEYEGYGSYWGGLGNPKKFREDVSSGDLKPIVKALDKLRDVNVGLYEKAGVSKATAERIYDEPGTLLMEKSGAKSNPFINPIHRKTVETALNLLTPRGVEDLIGVGIAGKVTGAGGRVVKGIKKILKPPKDTHWLESKQYLKELKKMNRKMKRQKTRRKVTDFAKRATRNWDIMSSEFFKKKIFYKKADADVDWDVSEFEKIVGLEIPETMLPKKILSLEKQKKWEKLFGFFGLKRLGKMHPGRLKRQLQQSKKFVKDEMQTRESFERLLNNIFPEHTVPKGAEGIDWRKGLQADFKTLDVDKYVSEMQSRDDLIKFLKDDGDVYNMYKELVGRAVDETPYSVIIAKGYDIGFRGIFRHGDKTGLKGELSSISEAWTAAFRGGFTKTHEFTHAVQLKGQRHIVKMTDDELAQFMIDEGFTQKEFMKEVDRFWNLKVMKKGFSEEGLKRIKEHTGFYIDSVPESVQRKIIEKLENMSTVPSKVKGQRGLIVEAKGSQKYVKGTYENEKQLERMRRYGKKILLANRYPTAGSMSDLARFQDFLRNNMTPQAKHRMATSKSSSAKKWGFKNWEEYYTAWYETGARINEIRHAQSLGIKRKIGAQEVLEEMYGEKFVKKLIDNYWAFLPAGEFLRQDKELWKDVAEAE